MNLKRIVNRGQTYALSTIGLSQNDHLLVSFPRAGNTWVRIFLFNLLCKLSRDQSGPVGFTFDDLNATMPEFGANDLRKPWAFSDICPRIVKTHLQRNVLFRKNPSLLIIRDPRDVMVSYYHYTKGAVNNPYKGSFSDFIHHPRYGFEAFLKHFVSWRDHAELIVRYEHLKSDPVAAFSSIAQFCGIKDVAEDDIQKALELSSLNNVRKAERVSKVLEDRRRKGFEFARKGAPGQWIEMFDSQMISACRELAEAYSFHEYKI